MCSVSWSRSRGGLVVVMNRDERRDRAPARPPRRWPGGPDAGGFTAPVDGAAGGTWIAVRDSGLVLALLNHHPASPIRRVGDTAGDDSGVRGMDGRARDASGVITGHRRPVVAGRRHTSRGRLVTALAAASAIPDARRLRAAGLATFAPFRLFVAGPSTPPRAFTWNGVSLTARRLDPRRGFLTSSSWNPRAVVAARQARFRRFVRDHRQPTRADLLAFHARTDDPRGTPWAICMAREDARTVSTTVVEAGPAGVSMRYRAR
jgi:hypothetical protein